MLTRARRRRIPSICVDCWEEIGRYTSAHCRGQLRMLNTETRDALSPVVMRDVSGTTIVSRGDLFFRLQFHSVLKAWSVFCVESDGPGGICWLHHFCRSLCEGSKHKERYNIGPLRLIVRMSADKQFICSVRSGQTVYVWLLDRKMTSIVRTHYLAQPG